MRVATRKVQQNLWLHRVEAHAQTRGTGAVCRGTCKAHSEQRGCTGSAPKHGPGSHHVQPQPENQNTDGSQLCLGSLAWGQYAPGLNASSDKKPPFEMLQKAIENSPPNKNVWAGQGPCSGFQESTMMRAIATHNEPVEFKNIH